MIERGTMTQDMYIIQRINNPIISNAVQDVEDNKKLKNINIIIQIDRMIINLGLIRIPNIVDSLQIITENIPSIIMLVIIIRK